MIKKSDFLSMIALFLVLCTSINAWGQSACAVPTGLTAVVTNSASNNSATVSWTPTTGATGYTVQLVKTPSDPNWNSATTVTVTDPSHTFTNVSGTYYWRVKSEGCSDSYYTPGYSFTVQRFTFITLVVNTTNNSALLRWNDISDAVNYTVQYKPADSPSWTTVITDTDIITLTGLSASTSYNWQVSVNFQAITTTGTPCIYSKVYEKGPDFTTQCTLPSAPTGRKATVEGTTVAISWAPVNGATSYRVRCFISGDAESLIESVVTGTSIVIPNLKTELLYVYLVRAINDCGESDLSGSSNYFKILPAPKFLNGFASGATAEFRWQEVNSATGYQIQYRIKGTTTWTYATERANAISASIPNLPAGTYEWQMATIHADGISDYAKGNDFVVAPVFPTNLQVSVSGTTATLSWAPAVNTKGYTIQYQRSTARTWSSRSTTATKVSLSSLTAGSTYYWQVRSIANTIYSSGPEFTIRPAAPTSLKTKVSGTTVTLSWTAKNGAASYTVQYKENASANWTTLTAAGNSISVPNLTPGNTYNWQVASVNAGGSSAYTKGANFMTGPVPPTNLQVSTSGRTAVLSWTAVNGATRYTVQYKKSTASRWSSKTVTGAGTSLTNLTTGSTYNWQVAATNSTGTSLYATGNNFTIGTSRAPAENTDNTSFDDTSETTDTGLEALNIRTDDIQLYPNPVHSVLYISGSDTFNANVERGTDKATTRAVIYNLSGSIVKTVTLPATRPMPIDVSDLSAGNYILKIADKSFKFIKQ